MPRTHHSQAPACPQRQAAARARIARLVAEKKLDVLRDFVLRTATLVEDIYLDNPSGPVVADDLSTWPDCWTVWRARAGLLGENIVSGDGELAFLLGRIRRFIHVSDVFRAKAYTDIARSGARLDELPAVHRSLAVMFLAQLFGPDMSGPQPTGWPGDPDRALAMVARHRLVAEELEQLFAVTTRRHHLGGVVAVSDDPGCFGGVLRLHADYSARELVAAADPAIFGDHPVPVTGDGDYVFAERNQILLLATVTQGAGVVATANRETYALSPRLVNWCSSPGLSAADPAAGAYIDQAERGTQIVIAVRKTGPHVTRTQQYCVLGRAHYTGHTGSCPVNFRLALEHMLPTDLCRQWLACGGC
ncbi:hypothetical protein ACFSSC_07125 [Corynebacterium mendelii]|uniref:Uncharacterized protein n=1 Tax=Corynebacterium mendelii TaxID=2765362 RepID=A0A939IUG1_9CORY|nr:hypothetical protein [Corynebacterium mendelii]MBN9644899.1 hypothetical protein [Corynebacterium mendelii]